MPPFGSKATQVECRPAGQRPSRSPSRSGAASAPKRLHGHPATWAYPHPSAPGALRGEAATETIPVAKSVQLLAATRTRRAAEGPDRQNHTGLLPVALRWEHQATSQSQTKPPDHHTAELGRAGSRSHAMPMRRAARCIGKKTTMPEAICSGLQLAARKATPDESGRTPAKSSFRHEPRLDVSDVRAQVCEGMGSGTRLSMADTSRAPAHLDEEELLRESLLGSMARLRFCIPLCAAARRPEGTCELRGACSNSRSRGPGEAARSKAAHAPRLRVRKGGRPTSLGGRTPPPCSLSLSKGFRHANARRLPLTISQWRPLQAPPPTTPLARGSLTAPRGHAVTSAAHHLTHTGTHIQGDKFGDLGGLQGQRPAAVRRAGLLLFTHKLDHLLQSSDLLTVLVLLDLVHDQLCSRSVA